MKLWSLQTNRLSIFMILLILLYSSFCYSQDNKGETPQNSKNNLIFQTIVEKRIKQIFRTEDADVIISSHKTYEINLSLIRLIMDIAEKNKPLKSALERYEFSPTDQNLQNFYKAAKKVMDEEIKKDPNIGDWKYLGHRYGGLSSIVYIHIYNFPDGVPADRNRDHLLNPIK